MKTALALFVALALALVVATTTARSDTRARRIEGVTIQGWHARAVRNRRLINRLRRRPLLVAASDPVPAIVLVFGRYAGQALTVARCESHLDTSAVNGQYLGLFQMGAHERALYGHGETALEQARAAFVYFVVSGRDWSPWSCKP